MKVFKDELKAKASLKEKEKLFLNGLCPYIDYARLCGNWCSLFHMEQVSEGSTPFVILGCKAGEKRLYVGEIIE